MITEEKTQDNSTFEDQLDEEEEKLTEEEQSEIAGLEEDDFSDNNETDFDEENDETTPIEQKGIPRILAALLIGGGILFLLVIIMTIMTPRQRQRTIPSDVTEETNSEEIKVDHRAKLALQNQVYKQEELENQKIEVTPQPQPQPEVNEEKPVALTQPQPTRQSTRQTTRQTTRQRQVQPSPQPEPTPVEINPVEQWRQLSAIGWIADYNHVSIENIPEETILPINNFGAQPIELVDPSSEIIIGESIQREFTQLSRGERGILSQKIIHDTPKQLQKDYQISFGASASAKVSVPLIFGGSTRNFAIVLTEPLLADDGSIALPINTMIVAEATRIQGTGVVSANASSIIYPDSRKRYQVPLDSIQILGERNQPLIADIDRVGGSSIGEDIFNSALSGIGRVGDDFIQDNLENRDRRINNTFSNRRRETSRNSSTIATIPKGMEVSIVVQDFIIIRR